MNVKELQDRVSKGEKFEYILFWDGPYSQWANYGFKLGHNMYPTAEHYMMYQKAMFFNDKAAAEKILASSSPRVVKQIGREVRNYNDVAWSAARYDVVVEGSMAKFTQHDYLLDLLLDSGDKIIVEASPFDTIWGIGMGEEDNRCTNPLKWKGQNLLGFAIMEVRDILRNKV